jgi:hypothetical protein
MASDFGGVSRTASVLLQTTKSPKWGLISRTQFPVATSIKERAAFGHHSTERTTSSVWMVFRQRPVLTSQSLTVPSSEPLARYCPDLSVLMVLTISVWPLYSSASTVGKGCKSLGLGSFGTRDSGSMLSFILIPLGHKYKSRHLKNLSLMYLGYAGTCLRDEYFCGTKCNFRFHGAFLCLFHCFSSLSSNRYSGADCKTRRVPGEASWGLGCACVSASSRRLDRRLPTTCRTGVLSSLSTSPPRLSF